MSDPGTYDTDALLRRAARSMETVVRQFEKRCQATRSESSDPAESARLAQGLRGRAERARMKLRDFHGRITHLVEVMRSHQVITRGEAQPVEEMLTRLLAQSLNRVEELLRRHERVAAGRGRRPLTGRDALHGAVLGYRLIRRWRNSGRDGWDGI